MLNDVLLMLRVKLLFLDRFHPHSDNFVTGVKNKTTDDTKLNNSPDTNLYTYVGGTVASWLVRSSPDRVAWVRTLAEDNVLCSLGKTLCSHSASLHPGVHV